MPEGSKKLSAKQKQVVRYWIEQGAKTKRPEPDNVRDVRYTPEELAFSSFQQIVARNDINSNAVKVIEA